MATKTISTMLELGDVVRSQRRKLKLKQADAAGLVGVGVRFFSELERGKETVAAGKALHVLTSLGLHVVIDNAPESSRNEK